MWYKLAWKKVYNWLIFCETRICHVYFEIQPHTK